MTERTLIRGESIEHLNHDPLCESKRHAGPAKPAEYWADTHGCYTGFACAACISTNQRAFNDLKATFGFVACAKCRKPFLLYTEWAKVELL